jgi:hypothetical protein
VIPCVLPEDPIERPSLPRTFEGGCHCGKVRFRATVRKYAVDECNCSMCSKKAYLHVIVPKEDFDLVSGAEAISTYTFNTHVAKHRFCSVCGVHAFYVPRSHPDGFSVNLRCLDDAPFEWFDVTGFDGRDWEKNVHKIR